MTLGKQARTIDIHAILYGMAIGDAFGAGVEFQDRNWIRENVDFSRLVNVRDQISVPPPDALAPFVEDYYPWEYTDDTETTVGLIRALASTQQVTPDNIAHAFHEEYLQGVAQKGYGRNGHGSMRWVYSGERSLDEVRDFQRYRPNPGNAPATRAVPLGLVPVDMIDDLAEANANATHPHPYAVAASRCVAWAAHYVCTVRGPLSGLIPFCRSRVNSAFDFDHYLSRVDSLPEYEVLSPSDFAELCGPQPIVEPYFLPGIQGVPSDARLTTGCILYVLKHCTGPFDALRKAVLLGGDVDSVAAACVGIMCGRDGTADLPAFMRDQVEGVLYLRGIAEIFASWLERTYPNRSR